MSNKPGVPVQQSKVCNQTPSCPDVSPLPPRRKYTSPDSGGILNHVLPFFQSISMNIRNFLFTFTCRAVGQNLTPAVLRALCKRIFHREGWFSSPVVAFVKAPVVSNCVHLSFIPGSIFFNQSLETFSPLFPIFRSRSPQVCSQAPQPVHI